MKLIIRKIRNIKRTLSSGIGNYFLGSINLYLTCELLKSSFLITMDKHHYDYCIIALTKNDCWLNLSTDSIYDICDMLNYQENYGKFITNLICMLLVVSSLLYNISFEVSYPFNLKYWAVSHISAIGFSLLNNIPIFQFSIASGNKYKPEVILIVAIVSIIIFILILRQACREKGLRYGFLASISIIYLFVFLMFKTVSSSITFHLHHALCSGFLSIFFTDFSSSINLYTHAIMMGITIQGINFYTLKEIFLFNVAYIPPPSFLYMSCVLSGYFIIWMLLVSDISAFKRLWYKYCHKRQQDANAFEIPLLVPSPEEIQNSSL